MLNATSDEPFFETEPLRENFAYIFRARARNSAGYGGYSGIWVVEVVYTNYNRDRYEKQEPKQGETTWLVRNRK